MTYAKRLAIHCTSDYIKDREKTNPQALKEVLEQHPNAADLVNVEEFVDSWLTHHEEGVTNYYASSFVLEVTGHVVDILEAR